jgi:hypothetical protein
VPYTRSTFRPAGNLHTSAFELGQWVHLLLNWGETENDLVIDPEYLSNMEHPRTTVASYAGLRNGYGSGIASSEVEGLSDARSRRRHRRLLIVVRVFHLTRLRLRHPVELDAFTGSDAAHRETRGPLPQGRCRAAAQVKATVAEATLRKYEGYYHDASPRNQAFAFIEWLMSGRASASAATTCRCTPAFATP